MGHPQIVSNVASHVADQLAISVISVEEQLTGWQRALNQAKNDARREQVYLRMSSAVESLASWKVLPFTLTAMSRHGALLAQRLNVGSNDLKIAATAIEFSATVVTRNRRDFSRVPGLALEDWS
jgi:tRNA(fMet)-specific endonuclease VapC